MPVTEIRGTITGITSARPPVVTSTAHGLANGDIIRITQVGGILNINNLNFRVFNITTDTFELQDEETQENIDATNFGTYTTGGRWNKINRIDSNRIFYT